MLSAIRPAVPVQGILIDFAEELFGEMGYGITINDVTSSSIFSAVSEGDGTIGIYRGGTENNAIPDTLETTNFTLDSTLCLLLPKDSAAFTYADLESGKCSVAVMRDSIADLYCWETIGISGNARIYSYDNLTDAVHGLSLGQADCLVVDASARDLLLQRYTALTLANTVFGSFSFGFVLREENALIEQIQNTAEQLQSAGSLNRIVSSWMAAMF